MEVAGDPRPLRDLGRLDGRGLARDQLAGGGRGESPGPLGAVRSGRRSRPIDRPIMRRSDVGGGAERDEHEHEWEVRTDRDDRHVDPGERRVRRALPGEDDADRRQAANDEPADDPHGRGHGNRIEAAAGPGRIAGGDATRWQRPHRLAAAAVATHTVWSPSPATTDEPGRRERRGEIARTDRRQPRDRRRAVGRERGQAQRAERQEERQESARLQQPRRERHRRDDDESPRPARPRRRARIVDGESKPRPAARGPPRRPSRDPSRLRPSQPSRTASIASSVRLRTP